MLAHDQVLELVAAADLFVMPSIRDPGGNIDGLPIVVLEAMAAGRPVVATDVAGMPLAVADGETGRLVPEKDAAALAGAVNQLLADADLRRRMGDAGRRRVEEELNWRRWRGCTTASTSRPSPPAEPAAAAGRRTGLRRCGS